MPTNGARSPKRAVRASLVKSDASFRTRHSPLHAGRKGGLAVPAAARSFSFKPLGAMAGSAQGSTAAGNPGEARPSAIQFQGCEDGWSVSGRGSEGWLDLGEMDERRSTSPPFSRGNVQGLTGSLSCDAASPELSRLAAAADALPGPFAFKWCLADKTRPGLGLYVLL